MAAPIPKLPNDVVIEILARLPVKSLLKFRCVSKSWLSLISSRQFTKSHLKNSKTAPNYTHYKVLFNCRGNFKHASLNSLLYGPTIDIDIFDADYLSQISTKSIRVVGSCDGLICLYVDTKDLILWNPSTRKRKNLPDFGVKTDAGNYCTFGLGFDESTDDYKVVGLFVSNKDLSPVIGKVYSLKTDQWKIIESYKHPRPMIDSPTFANGKFHWIANSDSELMSRWNVVTLDLNTEEYGIIEMPDYVEKSFYASLVANEGRLYVLCCYLTRADVWIIEGCGVREVNWIKVVSIPYVDDFLKDTYKRPLYVTEYGEVLFLSGFKFVVYDQKDCSFRYPEFRGFDVRSASTTYVETLVSPSF